MSKNPFHNLIQQRFKKTAMFSVYHKDGIKEFAEKLIQFGWKLIASGGTARYLKEQGIEVVDIADLIGGGAILGHRVVTLSREFYAGLLAQDTDEDWAELAKIGFPWIDLVCCDLYPLGDAVLTPNATLESVREKTDIGGPTMIRAAAKGGRLVVCRPLERQGVIEQLSSNQNSQDLRLWLAYIAEWTVFEYAKVSANFLRSQLPSELY